MWLHGSGNSPQRRFCGRDNRPALNVQTDLQLDPVSPNTLSKICSGQKKGGESQSGGEARAEASIGRLWASALRDPSGESLPLNGMEAFRGRGRGKVGKGKIEQRRAIQAQDWGARMMVQAATRSYPQSWS